MFALGLEKTYIFILLKAVQEVSRENVIKCPNNK